MRSSSKPRSRSERPRRHARAVRSLVGATLLLVLLTAIASISGRCDRLFYHPDSRPYSTPREYGLAFEPVTFTSRDGTRLSGWFLPAVGRAKGTVIHCHGNAQNMTSHWLYARFLPERGFNLLVFDYRGYGRSEGSPSRSGTVADAAAAIDYVSGRKDVDPHRIGMFGQSLGGAVAVVAAAKDPRVRAVVIDSTFSSYRGEAAHVLRSNPVTWLLSWPLSRLLIRSGLDPKDVIAKLSPRPVLIIHGTRDRIVPHEMARDLFERAGEPKELWLVDGARHTEALALRESEFVGKVCARFRTAFEGD